MSEPRVTSEFAADQITKEKLMEDLKVVVADAEELLKATANQTGDRILAARAKAGESLQAVKIHIAEAQAGVVEKVKVAAKTADDYVQENPWKSVGIAAALGIVLGALISRR